jgi:hypothetical protein
LHPTPCIKHLSEVCCGFDSESQKVKGDARPQNIKRSRNVTNAQQLVPTIPQSQVQVVRLFFY